MRIMVINTRYCASAVYAVVCVRPSVCHTLVLYQTD